jgi:hypothetical protein
MKKKKKKRRNANRRPQQDPQRLRKPAGRGSPIQVEDILAQRVEGVLANVSANFSPLGNHYRQMKDALANWPGAEEHDAALGHKALREKASDAGVASGDSRRENPSPSPIIEFIEQKLKRDRDISNADMVAALRAEAENGLTDGRITMSADGEAFVVMDKGEERHRLAIKSVPATVSRLRKKI